MAHLKITAALFVVALGLPAALGFAQEAEEKITPEWIENAYRKGVQCAAGGDDAGAESAFLHSIYLIERHFEGKHKTARPYLALADLLIEHREVFCALLCARRALDAPDYRREDEDCARRIAEMFVMANHPAIERWRSAVEIYGEDLPGVVPDGLCKALISLRAPGAKDADAARRLVDFVADAASRRMDEKRSLMTALSLIAAGLERLGASLEGDPAGGLRRPVERLRLLFRRCFEAAQKSYMHDSFGEDRVFEGRPPSLADAYRLGEVYRLRWRMERDRDGFAQSAARLFALVLESRPSHRAAARGLAEIQFLTGDKSAAAKTFQDLVSRLLVPSVAWDGPPRLPPAPRHYMASSLLEALEGDVVGPRGFDDPRDPAMIELGRTVDDRVLASYLEHRRFHPFDRVISWGDVAVRMENNAGFWLLQRWELRRAEQHLRRSIYLKAHAVEPKESMPVTHQNLGHLYYLQGNYERAIDCYRESFREDPENAVAANNLGALMGIFGSITLDIQLIRESRDCYDRALELAPDYVFAKHSKEFIEKVFITWDRYLNQKERTAFRVGSFGNSFLFAARSISESADPRYVQAMQILDAGLRAMPSEEEMALLFGERGAVAKTAHGEFSVHGILEDMRKTFDRCRDGAVKKYLALRREKGADHPAINFMLGETRRIAWRRSGSAWHRDRAVECYETTLAGEPDHAGAAAGLAELLRSMEDGDKRAIEMLDGVVGALLKPARPWPGEPEVPAAPRVRDAFDLAVRVVEELGKQGDRGALLRRSIERVLEAQAAHARAVREGREPEAWNNLGYLEVRAAEQLESPALLDQALLHVDRALELEPGRVGPAVNKILILGRLGRHAEAEAFRAAMQKKHPDDPRFKRTVKRRSL